MSMLGLRHTASTAKWDAFPRRLHILVGMEFKKFLRVKSIKAEIFLRRYRYDGTP